MGITRLQKWGNSYAVRIPKNLVNSLALDSNSPLEIREEDGKLIIVPVAPKPYRLSQLLEQITPQNLHGEVNEGPAQGKEVW